MIEDLDIGDMVVFKDGRQGTVDFIRETDWPVGKFYDYHLDFDFWIRWIPNANGVNKTTVRLLGIAKVIRHDKTRGHTQR